MIGIQRLLIEERAPISILGYLYALECNPPSQEWVQWVKDTTEIPPEAMYFLEQHAVIDLEHGADLRRVVKRPELTVEDREVILYSLVATATQMGHLPSELLALEATTQLQPAREDQSG